MAHTSASVYGTMIFCDGCGSLLDPPGSSDLLVCGLCRSTQPVLLLEHHRVVTASAPHMFPSALRNKQSAVQSHLNQKEVAAAVDEQCPNCGNDSMNFTTAQTRSADEGQTIFYVCPKCGHKITHDS